MYFQILHLPLVYACQRLLHMHSSLKSVPLPMANKLKSLNWPLQISLRSPTGRLSRPKQYILNFPEKSFPPHFNRNIVKECMVYVNISKTLAHPILPIWGGLRENLVFLCNVLPLNFVLNKRHTVSLALVLPLPFPFFNFLYFPICSEPWCFSPATQFSVYPQFILLCLIRLSSIIRFLFCSFKPLIPLFTPIVTNSLLCCYTAHTIMLYRPAFRGWQTEEVMYHFPNTCVPY